MTGAAPAPIVLVGAGRMGGALLEGWLARGVEPGRILVQEPSPSPEMITFLSEAGIGFGAHPVLPAAPSVIVLAVKPQMIGVVLPALVPMAGPETVLLSIAAGRTIRSLEAYFSSSAAIVRAMPNTPAAIGRGISALYGNSVTTLAQAEQCEALMAAVGDTIWIDDESLMDAVTAVSGSGPAYVFLLAECLADAGIAAGLPVELADRLARATISGAGELLARSDLDPEDLRRNVTSPGGTTAAALDVLTGGASVGNAGPFRDLLRDAVMAAARRSRDLAG